jgi:predicted acetyltransferase
VAVEVGPCSAGDLEALGKVWSITYGNGEPFTRDPSKTRLSEDFVAKQDGVAVGGFGISPMTATRGEAEFKCAGVLAVAVMPHIRGGGVGSAMMRYAIHEYRDRGYELASLYAFKDSFYRAFGYEVTGLRYKISVDINAFPRIKPTLPIRQLKADSVDVIKDCYHAFAHKRSGLNLRQGNQWDRILPKDSNRTVYVAGDPVEAYAVVQHKIDFWTDQDIVELVWTTQKGYDSLLSVFSGIGINKKNLVWTEPSDSPFRARYWDHDASVTGLTPQIMFRVLNVKKGLEGLKPSGSGNFIIEIVDEVVPENNGPWHVTFSPSGVQVESTAKAPGFTMDIRRFTQAFMGEPSLSSLLLNELFEVHDLDQVKAAEILLTPSPTLCFESF